MAFALVGVAGAASVGASGASVTPAYGQTPTAGNLLVCFISSTGSGTRPSPVSGWDAFGSDGTSATAVIWSRKATGGDAAPTIAGVAGATIAAHLEEWSGVTTSAAYLDRSGSAQGTSSPITATLAGVDSAAGTLVAMVGADFRSAARAPNDTWTSNNGTPVLRASNNGVSVANHYSHATMVTTSNAVADTAVMTLSVTTSITSLVIVARSFVVAPAATPVSGTGAGSRVASTSTGSAAETFVGTGGGTGTAATASGSGTSLQSFTGTGAGSQVVQTSTGTGAETISGTGAAIQAAQTSSGAGTETFTGTGAGSQTTQTSSGSGSSLLGASGSGSGLQAVPVGSGAGVESIVGSGSGTGAVPVSAGSGTSVLAATGSGDALQAVQTASGSGVEEMVSSGAGVQVPQTASGTGLHVVAGEIAGIGAGSQPPATGDGAGTVDAGAVIEPPATSGHGRGRAVPFRRLIIGSGGGVQVRQTAYGTGLVNDDELVMLVA